MAEPSESRTPPRRTALDGLRRTIAAAAAPGGWGRRRRALLVLQITVAVLLLAALVRFVDWRSLAGTIAAAEPGPIVAAALSVVAALLVGAFDLWVLLGAVAPVSYRTVLRVYVIAWSSYLAIPGSTGDAVQVLLLKGSDVGYGDGARIYFTDKLATLAVTLGVVIPGGWWVYGAQVRPGVVLGAAAAGLAVGLVAFALARRVDRLAGIAVRTARFLVAPLEYSRRHPGRLGTNLAGTVVKLLLSAASAWFVLRALDVEVPFAVVLVTHYLAGLVAYVPVAFNGIGTVEAVAVGLYGLLGVEPSEVLALYVVLRALVFALALVALALVGAIGAGRAES